MATHGSDPITFEQHARDVIGLSSHLGMARADYFGESFGGVIATMIAIRHPERVDRVPTYGATFGSPQLAVIPDSGHFARFSESERVIPVVGHFLRKATQRLPFATAGTGCHPGATR